MYPLGLFCFVFLYFSFFPNALHQSPQLDPPYPLHVPLNIQWTLSGEMVMFVVRLRSPEMDKEGVAIPAAQEALLCTLIPTTPIIWEEYVYHLDL